MKRRPAEQFSEERRDRETITLVRRKLEHSGHRNLRRVRASIEQGIIILTGIVATDSDREQAVELVRQCARVDSVEDNIDVESDVSLSQ